MPQQVNVVVNGVKIPIGQPGNQGNGQEDTTTKKTDFWTPAPGHPQASSGVFMVYDKRSTPAPVAYQPRHPGNQGNGQEDTTTKKTDFFWGNHKNTTNTTTTTTTTATTRGHPIASQGIFLVYDKSSAPAPVAYQPRHPGNPTTATPTTTTTRGHPIASQGVFMVYDKSSTPAPVAYQPRHPGNPTTAT